MVVFSSCDELKKKLAIAIDVYTRGIQICTYFFIDGRHVFGRLYHMYDILHDARPARKGQPKVGVVVVVESVVFG